MTRRTAVKWLHWLSFALLLYFFVDEPEIGGPGLGILRAAELEFHAGMGLILALLTLVWYLIYKKGGPLGRPGPKLPAWGKKAHGYLNNGLYFALPVMVATGGLAGLVADFPVRGFGVIPLNIPALGWEQLHDAAEEVHELAFDGLTILIIAHAAFHIWRHIRLRDNALRIMSPKALHRYL